MPMHRVTAYCLAQPQPIHARKNHVADDETDAVCPDPPQRLDAVGRVDHRTRRRAESAQASAEVEPHVRVVIDDQDGRGIHIVPGFSASPVEALYPGYRTKCGTHSSNVADTCAEVPR